MNNTYNSTMSVPAKQSGLTLVEVMIAITISLVMLAGILTIFASSKATYRSQEASSRLQENGRYAMNRLAADFRMAGFSGCNPDVTNHLNPAGNGFSNTLYDFEAAVGGWEYTTTGPGNTLTDPSLTPTGVAAANWADHEGNALHSSLQGRVVPGTDVVVTKRIVQDLNIPISPTGINANQIGTALANTGIDQYTILMITEDCISSDLFQKRNNANGSNLSKGGGSSTNPGPGNSTPASFPGGQKWSKAYSANATLLLPEVAVYFIGVNADSEPTLFRATYPTSVAAPVYDELVEGVENMQVLYGEDTTADGIPNRYVPINLVSDINDVSSVRISLLLRTSNFISSGTNTNSYLLSGYNAASATTINPVDDRRNRQVFSTTIKLRNRGLK
jgi:type IV pilus assembly protein PilW